MIPSRQRSCYIKYERNRTAKMKVVVCIGSSCHIKGSRLVVERLQALVAEHGVGDKVDLSGTFCLGRCAEGVCVLADGELFRSHRIRWTNFLSKMCLESSARDDITHYRISANDMKGMYEE